MSTLSRQVAAFFERLVHYGKVSLALLLLVGLIAVVGAALTYNGPATEFSNDGVAVATTTDGSGATVYYNVEFYDSGNLDTEGRKKAMDEVRAADICANTAINSHVESNEMVDVMRTDWSNVVGDCGTERITVSVERVEWSR